MTNCLIVTEKLSTITISREELRLIVAALHTVAPSGGGSQQFFLANQMQNLLGIEYDDDMQRAVERLSDVVVKEWKEATS